LYNIFLKAFPLQRGIIKYVAKPEKIEERNKVMLQKLIKAKIIISKFNDE